VKLEADSLTVLYVEDDFYVRESLLRLLRRRFSKVIEACDGREGLEMHRLHNPDFVITDIQMPVMDGLEMCECIMKEKPDAKVIVTTAFNDRELISKAECLGVKAYISKPVMKEALMSAIKAIFS
jgi:two-component system response regulator AtoC